MAINVNVQYNGGFLPDPKLFSVQQTTYRIGNHVYYWV